jgi:hypothetical protein
MQDLENKMRADGITVPLSGNHNATFLTGLGATDLPGFDSYPQGFDASNPFWWSPVPEWLEGAHQSLPPDKPLYFRSFKAAPSILGQVQGTQPAIPLLDRTSRTSSTSP